MSTCKGCDKNIPDGKSPLSKVSSWCCFDCTKSKFQAGSVIFLIAIVPGILGLIIEVSPFVFSKWVVILLWWILLWTIYYYRLEIDKKNRLIEQIKTR